MQCVALQPRLCASYECADHYQAAEQLPWRRRDYAASRALCRTREQGRELHLGVRRQRVERKGVQTNGKHGEWGNNLP